jgi:hypothetical protein
MESHGNDIIGSSLKSHPTRYLAINVGIVGTCSRVDARCRSTRVVEPQSDLDVDASQAVR